MSHYKFRCNLCGEVTQSLYKQTYELECFHCGLPVNKDTEFITLQTELKAMRDRIDIEKCKDISKPTNIVKRIYEL